MTSAVDVAGHPLLQGSRVLLRGRSPADAPLLHILWSDAETWLLAASGPYAPESPEGVRRRLEREADSAPPGAVWLTAEISRGTDAPAAIGMAGLWEIDQFNRRAHVSIVLLPEWRGKGYGTEVLDCLCGFAFRLRGLRRLEIETLARNRAMQSLAERCGFQAEGRLRQRDHDGGQWSDVVLYGLLADESAVARTGEPG